MATPVVVFATIKAKQGCADQVLEVLKSLIPPTLAEDGCVFYNLHLVSDDPNTFIFHETWESNAHLDAHMQTKHFLDASDKLSTLTDSLEILRATKL